jgi:excisionase family DNA binding protein
MGQQIAQAMGSSAGPKLYSPADAATYLRVSEENVLAALNDGSLKGKKIGSTWIITQQSLDEFLKD